MRRKKLLAFLLICTGTALLSLGLIKKFSKQGMLVISKGDNYEKLWKKVDSCVDKGLTESALKVVEAIYQKSKEANNAGQFVKSILYRMRLEGNKEEFSLEKSINRLREEAANARFPIKPVLQSILADSYWQYYQQNRWQINGRSATVNFKNDDLSTWDLKNLADAAIKNFKLSLQNSDSLKRTAVDVYDDIIVHGNTECRQWRSTLYDFLAHRALNFFISSEPDVPRPAARFTLNDEVYFGNFEKFLALNISNPSDSLETKFFAMNLMQDLIRFHEKDKDPDALLDLEIKRMGFMQQYSQNPKKDTLYLQSLQELQKKFTSTKKISEVDYLVANWFFTRASSYQPLVGDAYKWYKKKAASLCEQTIKNYPEAYGSKLCKNLLNSIGQKYVKITTEEVNEANKASRALVNSANLNKLYFKIVKTSYLDLKKLFRDSWDDKLYSKLNSLPVVKTFTQDITDDGDHNNHNTEIKLPELNYGYYLVLASVNPDFKYKNNLTSYCQYIVSDLSAIERQKDDGSHEFVALNRFSGEPLKNITVQVWHERYSYLTREYEMKKGMTLKTNEKGFFSLKFNRDEERSFFVELVNGADSWFSNNSYYSYGPYNEDYERTQSFFFTDRSIYRPGQTIYFKTIVLRSKRKQEHKILPNHPVSVTLYDVNGQKVSTQELTTNEYGTASGSFVAPQGMLNGQMYLYDGYGSVYFSVEDYKRPKFETKFNDIKGSYRINDSVFVGGVAKAYAGNVIDGAKVKYRVVRNVNYPYWWWWYRPYSYRAQQTEISNGEILTNDTGGYVIRFKALPDETVSKSSQATYQYQILADVTDINGETHSSSVYCSVGYQALNLSVTVDDKVNQKDIHPIKVNTQNLNGVAEPAKGNLTIHKLKQPSRLFRSRLWTQPDRHALGKEEYYKTFPFDLYEDENNMYKWAKEEKVLEKTFDTGNKTEYDLSAEIKNLKPGVYVMEGLCKDKFGEEIKAFAYFTVFSPDNNQIPENIPDWFYVSKSSAEPGEKISFIQASAYPGLAYLYEVEVKEDVKESKSIPASMQLNDILVDESHRGNLTFRCTFIRNNRFYSNSTVITVPYTNKELDITFETFRNKLLPGQEEEWKLLIKDKKGDKVAAELLAAMYDASLDAFKANYWNFNIYQSYYGRYNWSSYVGGTQNSNEFYNIPVAYEYVYDRRYDELNYFGLGFYKRRVIRGGSWQDVSEYNEYGHDLNPDNVYKAEAKEQTKNIAFRSANAQLSPAAETAATEKKTADKTTTGANIWNFENGEREADKDNRGGQGGEMQNVKVRSNFNETAFFYPQLGTNEKGETVIKFTIPESLTKWKVMGLAHTKDLKIGRFEKEVVTQKELMVQPNVPRFFREGDKMTFISKVANLSDKEIKGSAELKLYDALTEKEISTTMIEAVSGPFPSIGYRDFTVKKGQSSAIEWNLMIPQGYSAIKYKIVAKGGNFSDGEEMALPVLTNRMLVTESMPLPIRGNQTKEFSFTKFISQNNHSGTMRNHAYTLEFTANPAWYAVQALPYIMEYPYECAEQTFARYYANSLATYVVNSKPKIKAVFDAWKSQSPAAFLSNLEKNQDLKALVLEETPWVVQAKTESENKKRVGLLFDLNKMSNELARAFRKLQKAQTPNGGFCWFEGGPDDWYITQHICSGFGHLDKLGVLKLKQNNEAWNMMYKAVKYCDYRLREEYEDVKKYDKDYKTKNHLSYTAIQYLYMRSFYKDVEVDSRCKEAFEYYKKQEQTYWNEMERYAQGMASLSLFRFGDDKTAKDILRSIKENALKSEEMGMYWKENYGYYWYNAPIEQQAMMIEVFDEVGNDAVSVDDLKTWLIKSKQTQHWGTTRATTEAVYALLLKGNDWLSTEPNVEITLGETKLDPKSDPDLKVEPGTGYFKKTWSGADIKPEMGKIKVQKKDQGVSWGAVYWQYFEQLDKITPHETPLKLKKQLFVQRNTASGPVIEPISTDTKLKLGDKIKVRIELRVDRDMDYVHMKDMRAAGFEPTNVFSGYRWQDGLGYYESTRDAATNFFFSKLSKGTYVFEYPMVVNHYGDFSNGITQIQCMYAPEFASHSEGIRVKVGK